LESFLPVFRSIEETLLILKQLNDKTMDEQIKQIAERVRGLRDALGLGIDEMAESCGLASAQYAAIESGECDLSVSSLQKIARHFDVPLDADCRQFESVPQRSICGGAAYARSTCAPLEFLPDEVLSGFVVPFQRRPQYPQ
jgi:transcriptional regulator with XRE-family HTH domain